MKLAKGMYSDEEMMNDGEAEKPAETKSEPQVKAVSVEEQTQPEQKDMGDMGGDMGDMSLGTIKISSKDNPKVANWKLGKEYPMKVRMIGSDLDEDKKTIIGEFEIVK